MSKLSFFPKQMSASFAASRVMRSVEVDPAATTNTFGSVAPAGLTEQQHVRNLPRTGSARRPRDLLLSVVRERERAGRLAVTRSRSQRCPAAAFATPSLSPSFCGPRGDPCDDRVRETATRTSGPRLCWIRPTHVDDHWLELDPVPWSSTSRTADHAHARPQRQRTPGVGRCHGGFGNSRTPRAL